MKTEQMASIAALAANFESAKKDLTPGVHEVDITVRVYGTLTKGEDTTTTRVNPEIDPARVLTWLLAHQPELVQAAITNSSTPEFKEAYTAGGKDGVVNTLIANTLNIPQKIQTPRSGSVSAKALKVEVA